MQGVVEIYGVTKDGRRDLLSKEENMTVVGFSEQIVEMLTTPSAISTATPIDSAVLDSSNYTIQALSLGKAKEHYSQNLHTYQTKNLLYWTDFSNYRELANGELPVSSNPWFIAGATLEPNVIPGPVFGVSGTRFTKTSRTTTQGLQYNLHLSSQNQDYGYSQTAAITHPAYNNKDGSGLYFSATDVTFAVDLKVDESYMPDKSFSGRRLTEIKVTTVSGVSGIAVEWDSSGNATLFQEYADAGAGSILAHGGIKDLSGGWYRVFMTQRIGLESDIADWGADPFANDPLQVRIIPTTHTAQLSATNSDNAELLGAVYIARPQLEWGRHPTEYVPNHTSSNVLDDLDRFSILNESPAYATDKVLGTVKGWNYYVTSSLAGLSFSSLYGVETDHRGASAYIPPKTPVIPAPNPNDRVLVEGVRTPVETALGMKFIKGQNPAALSMSSTLMVSSYNSDWTYTSGYTPHIGRHAGFLGTFGTQHGTPTVIPTLNLVSALDEGGYTNVLSSVAIESGMDGQTSAVDRYGFIGLSGNGVLRTAATNLATFWVSAQEDFSSTGEIVYTVQFPNANWDANGASVSQKDSAILNVFGGVSVLGLWGIDQKETRKANPSEFAPWPVEDDVQVLTREPKRRYKLMSKKVLTDNIFRNEGDTTINRPGLYGYANLSVNWVLKFI